MHIRDMRRHTEGARKPSRNSFNRLSFEVCLLHLGQDSPTNSTCSRESIQSDRLTQSLHTDLFVVPPLVTPFSPADLQAEISATRTCRAAHSRPGPPFQQVTPWLSKRNGAEIDRLMRHLYIDLGCADRELHRQGVTARDAGDLALRADPRSWPTSRIRCAAPRS